MLSVLQLRNSEDTVMAVLLVVTNVSQITNTDHKTGWYLPEGAHPYKVFKDAGLHITVVSPNGGKAPLVRTCSFDILPTVEVNQITS